MLKSRTCDASTTCVFQHIGRWICKYKNGESCEQDSDCFDKTQTCKEKDGKGTICQTKKDYTCYTDDVCIE